MPSQSSRLPPVLVDLLGILPDAVFVINARGIVIYANGAVHGLLGYRHDEIVDQPMSLLVPQDVRERHEGLMATFRREGTPKTMGERPVLRAVHKSGRLVPVSISLCNLAIGADGSDPVSVAVVHDISLLQTHLDRAMTEAQTDPLTGLGNRLLLSRQIQANIANARPFGLLLMDLTGFKGLNDRHGHAAGDQALQVTGKRLQRLVRDSDVAARLGGDEFVLVIDGLVSATRLSDLADDATRSLSRPMRLADVVSSIGVNIGGAIYPDHGRTEDELLAAADRAMYAAKQARESYRLANARTEPR